MAREQPAESVPIGKFDILATYTYASALLDGLDDGEAKQRGMVAAIMGAKARLGIRSGSHDEITRPTRPPPRRRKRRRSRPSRSTSRSPTRWARFFEDVFLPTMRKLIEAGLSYVEVKRTVKIPSTWGAKISGKAFEERASKALEPKT